MNYQYRVIELVGEGEWDLQDLLDQYGSAGWELVHIGETVTGANRFRQAAVFKRPG